METDHKVENKRDILQEISPTDALHILRILVEEDSRFADRIYQIAVEILSNIDPDDIAFEVYGELNGIEVEDLWDRSGSKRYGYVDPSDEAWTMFEEALEPFIDEMEKYQKLGLFLEAKNYCIGILRGIYRYEKESKAKFKDWAVDAPRDYFHRILEKWKDGKPAPEDVARVEETIRQDFADI